ncbi:hypothetical protein BKG89_01340 [Rodentibacter caecimuris]|uniref:Peptidase C39 domain-containing protein n=1 Tax=Rodentibacter caecimuris TaxID=1796644 RepID=A0ABX3KZG0_9PAST|nr:hypothetical protein BKG89_01340 [Rodentibacter heylii]
MLHFISILKKIFKINLLFLSSYALAKDITSYNEIRNFNVIRQTKDNSCGAAALATILKYKFNIHNVNEEIILSKMKNPDKEASFFELKKISNIFNINAIGLALTINELLNIKKPVIAYVNTTLNNDHFVIINGFNKNTILISDPAVGNYSLSISDFEKIWSLRDNGKGDILYLYNDSMDAVEFIENFEKKHRIFLKK